MCKVHTEAVRCPVTPEQRLVYEVNQAWEPLYACLEVAVPEPPFPRVNDSDTLRQYMQAHLLKGLRAR